MLQFLRVTLSCFQFLCFTSKFRRNFRSDHSPHPPLIILVLSSTYILWSTSVDLSKGIVVLPPSLFLFLFFFLFFLFFCIFCGLFGSFYLSLICPLWDLFMCPLLGSFNLSSLGSFPHLRATLYILQESRRSSHFIRSTQHKEN